MPAQLVSLSDEPSILLDKPILLIGRHPECDIQIESRKVSRRHCCIAQVSDYLVVRDLGSTNGIRINGARVQEGKLGARDELTIGGNRYQVSWDVLPGSVIRPQRAVAKPVAAKRSGLTNEDEMLERCDEPIPLADPVRPPEAPCRPQREIPASARSPALAPRPRSLIVPENLNLAAGSDPKSDLQKPPSFNDE